MWSMSNPGSIRRWRKELIKQVKSARSWERALNEMEVFQKFDTMKNGLFVGMNSHAIYAGTLQGCAQTHFSLSLERYDY